jgi:hypothetical protein
MATRRQAEPPKLSLSFPSTNRLVRETLDSLTSTISWIATSQMTTALPVRQATFFVAGTASFAQ